MPTKVAQMANLVVLVGGDGELEETTRQAAMYASGAALVVTPVASLATVAAERRPYAIVVPRHLYDFGGSELDALARDVGAGLFVVNESVQVELLRASLADAASRLG